MLSSAHAFGQSTWRHLAAAAGLAALTLLSGTSAQAQTQSCGKPQVLFVNGVWNWLPEDAKKSAMVITDALAEAGLPTSAYGIGERPGVRATWNPGDGRLADVLEVFSQQRTAGATLVAAATSANTAFGVLLAAELNGAPSARFQFEIDKFKFRLLAELNQQRPLVVVAHSQGNILVNRAVAAVLAERPDAAGRIAVVGVGVADDRSVGAHYRYITSDRDKVINGFAGGLRLPGALPANFTILTDGSGDTSGHLFAESYMTALTSGSYGGPGLGPQNVTPKQVIQSHIKEMFDVVRCVDTQLQLIAPSPRVAIVGVPTTFRVGVTPAADNPAGREPTGTMSIVDANGKQLCSAPVVAGSREAACSVTFAGPFRTESFGVRFSGTNNYIDSSIPLQPLDLSPQAPGLSAGAAPNPAYLGSTVSASATVSPPAGVVGLPIPTGQVFFRTATNALLCTAVLDNTGAGSCLFAAPGPARNETVVANYEGDRSYVSAQRSFSLQLLASNVNLTASIPNTNPLTLFVGDPVALAASVVAAVPTPGIAAPTGNVTFKASDGRILCSAPISGSGATTCTATFTGTPRTESVRIEYGGDAYYNGTSTTLALFLDSRTKHWSGSYRITAHNATNLGFGFAAENPPFSLGPVAGAYKGYFHFADDDNRMVFGASVGGGGEDTRNVYLTGWRSTASDLSVSVPIGFPGFEGTRTTVFRITSRTATTISGTVTMTTTSGVFTTALTNQIALQPVTATGDWTANLVYTALPATDMKGFDFCFGGDTAAPQMANIDAGYRRPSWAGGFVSNGCVFGGF